MNDLFENGNYNNNFVDVLVNVCGKYFGLDFLIFEKNSFNTHIIPIERTKTNNNNDNLFPDYNNFFVIFIRTGVELGNDSKAHYDLAVPKNLFNEIDNTFENNNRILLKDKGCSEGITATNDIIEVPVDFMTSNYIRPIVAKTWLIDKTEWLSAGHISIMQNLIKDRYGDKLNLTGLLHTNKYLDNE